MKRKVSKRKISSRQFILQKGKEKSFKSLWKKTFAAKSYESVHQFDSGSSDIKLTMVSMRFALIAPFRCIQILNRKHSSNMCMMNVICRNTNLFCNALYNFLPFMIVK